ncbi:hypothetical protein BN1723_017362, partial [Verticillium longisporum]
MGKSGSGKSSMRSIIFSNYIARDTRRLGATIDIDLSHVKFLGNLTLNLWDCGGQEAFMENYLSQQRVHVFSNVGVLIYVFDIESRDVDRDLATYVSILSALLQFSPQARIYVLIHKMDLVVPAHRESVYDERVRITEAAPAPATTPEVAAVDTTAPAATTASIPPPEAAVASTTPSFAEGVASAPTPVTDASTFELLTDTTIAQMPEQIGYLKAIGLDFGYGPSSCMQWILEHMYIYTGMPWWATIGSTVLLLRLLLLKPTLNAQQGSAKMQQLQGNAQYAALKQKMQDSMKSGDKSAMMDARQSINHIHKREGVNPFAALWGLVQIPFSYGLFI